MRSWFVLALLAACGGGSHPGWLSDARVVVDGVHAVAVDCRTQICVHNENTDLTVFEGATYLVHRTATSQILGPNSSLRVYRSDDHGGTFDLLAVIPAPIDRDLRDPCFYVIDGHLAIKALTRLPVNSTRDSDVQTIAVGTISMDAGQTWSPLAPIGPTTWSFWRIKDDANGVHYNAAYEDGDKSVRLFSSTDGVAWTMGAVIYDVSVDTPLETELVFMPSGRLLALVRMDGTDAELLGTQGRLRTKLCWAQPPYASFDCAQEIDGQRLDGPLAFFWCGRLLVVARKHLWALGRKRTSVFELTGNFEGGPLQIRELRELPSAGDTSYAGAVERSDGRVLLSWYSSDLHKDPDWAFGIISASDIWTAIIDPPQLQGATPAE